MSSQVTMNKEIVMAIHAAKLNTKTWKNSVVLAVTGAKL